MYTRLLTFLRCPECHGTLELVPLVTAMTANGNEISEGLLHCARQHWFPIVRGVPRMLPDALDEHWENLACHMPTRASEPIRSLMETRSRRDSNPGYDRRTRESFSLEWDNHDLGERTWGMQLQDRVQWFFLQPLRIPLEELDGKVMLDAGCGNGSQSVAYTEFGLEVIAMDLSSGVEYGHAFASRYPQARPARVHFVQGDLQRPPLAPASVDLIHSAGVLHHTPDTPKTFHILCPLLRQGGLFYVWLYKYERWVTPMVNAMRTVTTRIPAATCARITRFMAIPFLGFCAAVHVLGIRTYSRLSRREAAVALMDIFGAPHAHYHSFDEVGSWYRAAGFEEIWGCNDGRRGFGVCGRLAGVQAQETLEPMRNPTPAAGQEGNS